MWYVCVFVHRGLMEVYSLASRSNTSLYFLSVCKISRFVANVGTSPHLHATRGNDYRTRSRSGLGDCLIPSDCVRIERVSLNYLWIHSPVRSGLANEPRALSLAATSLIITDTRTNREPS